MRESYEQFQSMLIDRKMTKFTWKIKNFSSIEDKSLVSDRFHLNGKPWRIVIYPKGNSVDHLSIYLKSYRYHSRSRTQDTIRYAQFGLAVIDQIDRIFSKAYVNSHEFKKYETYGFTSFLPLCELHNPERGYLVNDVCIIEAYITACKTRGLISREFIVGNVPEPSTASSSQPSSQKTTTASSTQRSGQGVAIEPEETTTEEEEEISTFFTTLESELSSSNLVFSQEEAKEALDKLDKALIMSPFHFYCSGKFSQLKQVFKILASFGCSSTTLTTEHKNGLLTIEESLKELADQAAKAAQDKNCPTAKESTKVMITRNLECSLNQYKDVEAEVKQVEQELAALHAQVEKAQKKRDNLLAKQKGIFRSSKRMKMELKDLGNEWAEYEARAKVAEAEEKMVEAKWKRLKEFISSLNGII